MVNDLYIYLLYFHLITLPGAGEPNFDGLDANPYRSAKQRQEWEVKALLEKIQPELISLDPRELGQVDRGTFEQKHQDRVQALVSVFKKKFLQNANLTFKVTIITHTLVMPVFQGFDPLAKEKFVPKFKKKGRSSAGSIERRKRQVAHVDQRVRSPEYKLKFVLPIRILAEIRAAQYYENLLNFANTSSVAIY